MDILAEILAHKRQQVTARKNAASDSINTQLAAASPPKDFVAALQTATANQRFPVIAEIKQKSPSKGILCEDFLPASIAAAYAANGAACLSVLTDEKYFGGSNEDLQTAAAGCEHALPILRKEFIIDEWQISEARAIGADAILLIVAALSHDELITQCEAALKLNMAVLVEVHDSNEMDAALATPAEALIGINNRNLKTFETDLQTSVELLPRAKQQGRVVVSESGIHTAADVARLQAAGADAFLIGEALVNDPSGLQKLFA